MKFQIKSLAGSVLFEGDFTSLAACVTAAVRAGSNLRWSDLSGSNLRWSDLSGSDLSGSNLRWSDLSGSNLSGSDLSGSDLRWSDLSGSNLSGSNLSGSNLSGSDLRGSNLSDAKNAALSIAQTRILPQGDIIGWKKCAGGIIAKLRIPEAAKRSHAFGRKCRAEYASVIELWDGDKPATKARSGYDNRKTLYTVGQIVRPDAWCDDYREECAAGIHFFITREEAEAYDL